MSKRTAVRVEISPGELFDKITVLRVKLERISDGRKQVNIRRELQTLLDARADAIEPSPELDALSSDLRAVNAELYDVIDAIYACEARGDPPERFVELARSVYLLNDRRALIKKQINLLLGSKLVEEKGHELTGDRQRG